MYFIVHVSIVVDVVMLLWFIPQEQYNDLRGTLSNKVLLNIDIEPGNRLDVSLTNNNKQKLEKKYVNTERIYNWFVQIERDC